MKQVSTKDKLAELKRKADKRKQAMPARKNTQDVIVENQHSKELSGYVYDQIRRMN